MRPGEHRFGSVGRPHPGVEIQIADDGEILLKGPNIFGGYYNNDDASFGAVVDGWLHTGDVGRLDEDGFVYIVGRKKDIIITAGGKNLTPANLENDLKQSPLDLAGGDARRPPSVPDDADHARRGRDRPVGAEQGLPTRHRRRSPEPGRQDADPGRARPGQREVRPVEQVKRFAILDHDFSQETGRADARP